MIHENSTLGEIIKHYEDMIERIRRSHSLAYEKMMQDSNEQSDRLRMAKDSLLKSCEENERLSEENARLRLIPAAPTHIEPEPKRPWWRII